MIIVLLHFPLLASPSSLLGLLLKLLVCLVLPPLISSVLLLANHDGFFLSHLTEAHNTATSAKKQRHGTPVQHNADTCSYLCSLLINPVQPGLRLLHRQVPVLQRTYR